MLESEETKETKEMDDKGYADVKAVRLKNYLGDYGFYVRFDVVLSSIGSGKFLYRLMGADFFCSGRIDVISFHGTPEGAWQAKLDAERLLEGSRWKLDMEELCMVDPEGIRFTACGKELS